MSNKRNNFNNKNYVRHNSNFPSGIRMVLQEKDLKKLNDGLMPLIGFDAKDGKNNYVPYKEYLVLYTQTKFPDLKHVVEDPTKSIYSELIAPVLPKGYEKMEGHVWEIAKMNLNILLTEYNKRKEVIRSDAIKLCGIIRAANPTDLNDELKNLVSREKRAVEDAAMAGELEEPTSSAAADKPKKAVPIIMPITLDTSSDVASLDNLPWLLRSIERLMTIGKSVRNTAKYRHQVSQNFNGCKQPEWQSLTEYKTTFEALYHMAEEAANIDTDGVVNRSETRVKLLRAGDKAMKFFEGLDDYRFGDFKVEIENAINQGTRDELTDIDEVVHLASVHKPRVTTFKKTPGGKEMSQMVFHVKASARTSTGAQYHGQQRQQAEKTHKNPKKGDAGARDNRQPTERTCKACGDSKHKTMECPKPSKEFLDKVTCFNCGAKGHWQKNCPEADEEYAIRSVRVELQPPSAVKIENETETVFVSAANLKENTNTSREIGLDTMAQCSIFRDAELLTNIRKSKVTAILNGVGPEPLRTNMIGDHFLTAEPVRITADAPANLLCFADVTKTCAVSYDKDHFTVSNNDKTYHFHQRGKLYVCNLDEDVDGHDEQAMVIRMTAREKESGLTVREVEAARAVKEVQLNMALPSPKGLVELANSSMKNVPFIGKDVMNAEELYGPMYEKKAGFNRLTASPKPKEETLETAPLKHQKGYCDVFYILEKLPFVICVLKPLDVWLVNYAASEDADALARILVEIVRDVEARGFVVDSLQIDSQRGLMNTKTAVNTCGVTLDVMSKGEHVSIAENAIQHIKGRIRGIISSDTYFPYDIDASMLVWCVLWVCACRNASPNSNSPHVSPRANYLGTRTDYEVFKLRCGQYVMVKEFGAVNHNSVQHRRTIDCIALCPTNSSSASWRFLNLHTGLKITRPISSTTALDFVPESVMKVMNERARKAGVITRDPRFYTDRPPRRRGNGVVPPAQTAEEGAIPIARIDIDKVERVQELNANTRNEQAAAADVAEVERERDEIDAAKEEDTEPAATTLIEVDSAVPMTTVETETDVTLGVYATMIDKECKRTSAATEIAAAKKKELKQLVDRGVFDPTDSKTLHADIKRKCLPTHMLVKNKYDNGTKIGVKGRCAAGGNHQDHETYSLEETAAPTISLLSLFVIINMGLKLAMKTFNFDITGAYLYADMIRDVYVVFEKDLADILVDLVPDWRKYIGTDGKLYAKLKKALYGCIEAAKLWYNTLSGVMQRLGFVAHPMDPCVFVRGQREELFVVGVHVDDGKGFCQLDHLVEQFKKDLASVFKATFNEDPKAQYLGMMIDYNVTDKKATISLPKIIEDILKEMKTTKRVKTPHDEGLYTIDITSTYLDYARTKLFHSIVYKLLWCTQRTELRIMLAVNFLSGRVQKPTEQDWDKLQRVLQFLYGTKRSCIVLSPDDGPFCVEWYIDAAFAVRSDTEQMRSQAGDVGFLNGSLLSCGTGKLKIATKSSTDTELVSLSDRAGKALWVREFITSDVFGFKCVHVHLREDNRAVIQLLKKGHPESDRSRHVRIRYFWLHYELTEDGVKLIWVSDEDQLADSLTKPTVGRRFAVHFDKITGAPLKYCYPNANGELFKVAFVREQL